MSPTAERKSAPKAPPPRRLNLRHLLFALMLLPGLLPMLVSSYRLLVANRTLLRGQQTELLSHSAQSFVDRLSQDLTVQRLQMMQLGRGLVAPPGPDSLEERLREPWALELLRGYLDTQDRVAAFNVLASNRRGVRQGGELNEAIELAMIEAFDMAVRTGEEAYRFTVFEDAPAVSMAVPVPTLDGQDTLVLQSVIPLALGSYNGEGETFEIDDFFLIDSSANLLWSSGSHVQVERALLDTDMVQDFARVPFTVSRDFADLQVGGDNMPTLARIVAVRETGWGVVAHKSSAVAFASVRKMVTDIGLYSILAVMLALFFAALAARWFSLPIQRLAQTSHEIAAGKFDRRVAVEGLVTVEIADMAADFNRMSAYVEKYVEQLQRAAEANRNLFLNSIRAFAAAIDAKDPYTRGHSERVAAHSRAIARYLGLPKDVQEKVWISAVLHDVGKIGVQDRVLLKHGVLTTEEFEQMKLHPAIGADIVEPIKALQDMLPGIRWHHEAWNGTGYPDKLKGDQIPLMARIIGVADTYDAITTNRPYQTASSAEYAIETIKKLTGTKFDAKVVTAFLLAFDAGHIRGQAPAVAAAPAPAPAQQVVPS